MLTGEIVRFLVLIAIFASVFLLAAVIVRSVADSQAQLGAINRRMKLIAKGADREEIMAMLRKNDPNADLGLLALPLGFFQGFRRKLMMSAIPFSAGQVLLAMVALFALLILILVLTCWLLNFPLTGGVIQIITAFAAAAAIGIPVFVITFVAERRRKKMQEQFPVSLDIFVRALRSGHPVASAIELVTREMQDPIGSEFGLISDDVSYGAELTEALDEMAERWDMDDIRMFVVSLSVQSETGGNLAEILDNLAKVIRERASLYMKVRAMSSEGRMTGWILTAAPIVTFLALFSMNPQFYLGVAQDPIFYIGFPLMILWYLVGVYSIRRMIDLKV